MIQDVILDFDDAEEPVHVDDIFSYNGSEDFTKLRALEGKVDTRELTLSFLGDTFPNLRKLRLNNSVIPSIRDIGCTLVNLRFLSLARCNISSLDGIATISQNLEELYLAFNKITSLFDLMGMEKLKIVDLEDNLIDNLESIEILSLCSKLRALTLSGNPGAVVPDYRERVTKLLPQLVYLDEKRLKPKTSKVKPPPLPRSTSSSEQLATPIRPPDSPPEKSMHRSSSQEASPIIEITPPPSVPPVAISKIVSDDLDNERVMTEMVDDLVEDRPPTSRGFYGQNTFSGYFKTPTKNKAGQRLVNQNTHSIPRIVRPMSAKGRPFQ